MSSILESVNLLLQQILSLMRVNFNGDNVVLMSHSPIDLTNRKNAKEMVVEILEEVMTLILKDRN
jgi:hypothetical protein